MVILYFDNLVLIFFIYSVAGWVMEVTLKYFQYHRFINRGFLIGPYCPIYGTGAVIVTIISNLLSEYDSSLGTSFLISFFFCGALEYYTSFMLEKRFHARWWDYSFKPMNFHGRVWIGNLILFGIGGMLIDKVFNPYIMNFLGEIHIDTIRLLSTVIILIMGADYILSHFIIKLLKEGVESSEADKSEAIAKEVRYLLENKSVFHRRIIDAYPELVFRTERVKARLERVKNDTEKLKMAVGDRLNDLSDIIEHRHKNISRNLITTRNLQKDIIKIQEEIISNSVIDENYKKKNQKLFANLEEKKKILQQRDNFDKFL